MVSEYIYIVSVVALLGGFYIFVQYLYEIFVFCSKVTNEHQHLTSSNEYKAGWSFYLVLAGVVTTLGSSLPVGYNIGVVNTPAEV